MRSAVLDGNTIAGMHYIGAGVPQDFVEAVTWWRTAAEQGYAPAQYELGLMYADGEGVPQNYTEAAKWYRMAAEQGFVSAQLNLGLLHANGAGVPPNAIAAYVWFSIAGDNGNETAQTYRGVIEEIMDVEEVAEAKRLAQICKVSDYQNCDFSQTQS